MNPQDQSNSPDNTRPVTTPAEDAQTTPFPSAPISEQSSPEADAAALQAIDALESEELGDAQETQPVGPVTTAPAPQSYATAPVTNAAPVTPSSAPIVNEQPSSSAFNTPEAPVTAASAAVGASFAPTQTPASTATSNDVSKKKLSTTVIVLIVAVLVVVAALAGYFVWQSME